MAPGEPGPGQGSLHEGRIGLKGGREVFLRPIRETDGDLIVALFNRFSPETVHFRFLARLSTLPEGMVHHFTHLDPGKEFALAALAEEDRSEVLISVARYAFDPRENLADLAIAVRDDWQNLGLGKALLSRLVAIAKGRGITRFRSMMDPLNRAMGKTLRDLGYQVSYSAKSGFYEVEILV